MKGWSVAAALVVAGCDLEGGEGYEGGGNHDTGTCSTGAFWSGEEGSTMEPGGDCIACHKGGEGPDFTSAGTVMAAYDDPNDCYGVQGVAVHVIDANGVSHDATTNSSGNFSFDESIPTPVTATVEYQGRVGQMTSPQGSTDCASCHTAAGENGAPGRIVAP